jgi:cell division protein FtsB
LRVSENSETLSPARVPRPATRGSRVVRLALIIIAAVVLVDALVGEKGLLATIRARHEYTELSAQISRKRTENIHLREVARGLREDPNAIEELARRELGLIRPGETLFIIKDVTPAK